MVAGVTVRAQALSADLEKTLYAYQLNWEETNCFKSWHERNDPDYQAAVAIGKPAIPFLIKMLGESWFSIIVLLAIIGDSPIAKEHAGMFGAINEDLRAWAKDNGYV